MLMQIEPAFQVGQIVDWLPVGELISVPMPKRWYIRRTAPNREFKVIKRARQLGLSAYLPTLTSRREFHRCAVSPLITGAILVPDFEVEAENWKYVDGLFGWLRFGDYLPTLSPKLLADIRRIEAIGNTPKSKRQHYFEIGQLVRVVSGPFRGFSARVERFDGIGRISVGIEIFSRITPAEFDEGEIEAV
jgi:transcriptional antiterminator NusG